jgi:hypothetical protein
MKRTHTKNEQYKYGVRYKMIAITPELHTALKVYCSTRPLQMREGASILLMIALRHAHSYENEKRIPCLPQKEEPEPDEVDIKRAQIEKRIQDIVEKKRAEPNA